MVKTRHSGDVEESSPQLMTLRNEHANRVKSGKINHCLFEVESDQNSADAVEEKIVESRLRPRTGPRRDYNYLDVDSSASEDENYHRRQRRLLNSSHYSPRMLRRSSISKSVKREIIIESQGSNYRQSRSLRRRTSLVEDKHSSPSQDEEEEEDDDDMIHTRRSSRTTRSGNLHLSKTSPKHRDDENNEQEEEDEENEKKELDMYSRVKRKRLKVKRNMYGVPIPESASESDTQQVRKRTRSKMIAESEEEEENEEDENNDKGRRMSRRTRKPVIRKSYSLREHKPRTVLYKAPVEEPKMRRAHGLHSIFSGTPVKKNVEKTYQSPAQRRKIRRKKRSAFHSSSSSTSTSSTDSSDEKRFKRRKSKSMSKSRSTMMPMNFLNSASSPGVVKDRCKSGASLADVEPMDIDRSITFDSVGGLGKHIRALKEMVVFPLLYGKVFERFKIDPPRGVLFYGPPGTGKTLVARALANECSSEDKKVAFFMRKGADCLSKWVGESERQLRLLFDQAYKYRPSVIFFDEIDGLAPVRSSRQDQIHSSIVSTLLALMDGLDSRGEIVVIGATNRIDSLDPALRRPGRFDREFLFPLPSVSARQQILKIHTSGWQPRLSEQFISELAEKCVGYCGADLKALCMESAMSALRRQYPQIYQSNEPLEIDTSSIVVSAKDFFRAMNTIIPTSQRAMNTPQRALSLHIVPLLQRQLDSVVSQLCDSFPPCVSETSRSISASASHSNELLIDDLPSDDEDEAPSIFVNQGNSKNVVSSSRSYLNFTSYVTSKPVMFRPRMMLCGGAGQGQTTHVAPAVIHKMENLPVHVLDLPTLYGVTAKTPEESCANVFHEAKRKCPSIIYLPYINQWWSVMDNTLKATLLTLSNDLNPTTPILMLATSELPYSDLDPVLQSLFSEHSDEVYSMLNPSGEERKEFFRELLLTQAIRPPPQKKQAVERMLKVLPKAKPVKTRELTATETRQLEEKEELTLMELRIFLRDVLNKLASERKFSVFAKPVDAEDAPDYYEIIKTPMDFSTMMSKIDLHEYNTVQTFMKDLDVICSNALEYNPNRGPTDRVIRHRACALKDTAYAIIKTELDKEFEKKCQEIEESRKRRGADSKKIPNFYYTKPKEGKHSSLRSQLENTQAPRELPKPDGERFSKRLRGLNLEPMPALEDVEKVYKQSKSMKSPDKDDQKHVVENDQVSGHEERNDPEPKTNPTSKDLSSSISKPKSKSVCVWCRPKRKKRKLSIINKTPTVNKRIPSLSKLKTSPRTNPKSPSTLTTKPSPTTNSKSSEKAEAKDDQSPALPKEQSRQMELLNVDVSHIPDDVKNPRRLSPRRRNSSSLTSPNSTGVTNTQGVATRRSSMSPRIPTTAVPCSPPQTTTIEVSKTEDIPMETEDSTPLENLTTESDINLLAANPSVAVEEVIEKAHAGPDVDKVKKPSVVKKLNLDGLVVDSGAGSSLESNCDSRDSTDSNKLERETVATDKVCKSETTNDKNMEQAAAILNKPQEKLLVDIERLTDLLDQLVEWTHDWTVEQLEKIYSQLSQIIFTHRQHYDRTDMIMELEQKASDLAHRLS